MNRSHVLSVIGLLGLTGCKTELPSLRPPQSAQTRSAAPGTPGRQPTTTKPDNQGLDPSVGEPLPAAPFAPAQPVAYDPARDAALAQELALELERLVNRGRFAQMRPYLDELYALVGYLEARQPRSLTQLTVRRAMHLIRKPDLKAAAGEIARAQQELGMLTDKSAKEFGELLAPARHALERGDRKAAEDTLNLIRLDDVPGDFASAARGLRTVLANLDLDISRQNARMVAMGLKDLTDALAKLEVAVKNPLAGTPIPRLTDGESPPPPPTGSTSAPDSKAPASAGPEPKAPSKAPVKSAAAPARPAPRPTLRPGKRRRAKAVEPETGATAPTVTSTPDPPATKNP